MRRQLPAIVLIVAAAGGCRTYDSYTPLATQKGYVAADQWAGYGHEQAEVVALGREFARAHVDDSPEGLAAQVDAALAYAKTLPDIVEITADTLGHRLTVRFRSGWRTAVLPLDDGKAGADTPGLPISR